MLGIQTRGSRMEGANESTELRRHPSRVILTLTKWQRYVGARLFLNLYVIFERTKTRDKLAPGGGQVVSLLAFYFDDPSLNHAEATFYEILCLKRSKRGQAWTI